MSSNCDRIGCGRPISRRICGRGYCERCAEALAESLRVRTGRRILDVSKLPVYTA
jgi:hypothetical protein